MASKHDSSDGFSFPIAAMLVIGVASALVTGASFWIITRWPLPASVEPYYNFHPGWVWGAVIGGVSGLVIGYLTDERHFSK